MARETLASAKQKLRNAERRFEQFMIDRFPVGSAIHWRKGEHAQCGEVIMHGSSGRVKVLNWTTQKSYWIETYFIIDRKDRSNA